MQIEAGKYYKDTNGDKRGPAIRDPSGPWWVLGDFSYWDNGDRMAGIASTNLIAVWSDELPHDGTVAMDAIPATQMSRADEVRAIVTEVFSEPDGLGVGPVTGLSPDELLQELDAREHEPPLRVQILHAGAQLTNGQRDREYGPPSVNMAASGALKQTFRDHLNRDIGPAELEAIDMCLTKLGRLATGTPKLDTYIDAATYLAIAGEIALTTTPATGA